MKYFAVLTVLNVPMTVPSLSYTVFSFRVQPFFTPTWGRLSTDLPLRLLFIAELLGGVVQDHRSLAAIAEGNVDAARLFRVQIAVPYRISRFFVRLDKRAKGIGELTGQALMVKLLQGRHDAPFMWW
jgi:hypothetical protein